MKSLNVVNTCFALSIFIIAFALNIYLSRMWYNRGVFDQYNILFNSDPNIRLNSFAYGGVMDRIIHPGLPFIVSFPIYCLSALLGHLFAGLYINDNIKLFLALSSMPIALSMTTIHIYIICWMRQLKVIDGYLICLIYIFSFSNIIFGSIPDHFALSNLSISTSILMSIICLQSKKEMLVFWPICLILAGLVTITNFIPAFFLMTLTALLLNGLRRDIWIKITGNSIFSLSFICLFRIILFKCFGLKEEPIYQTSQWIKNFLDSPIIKVLTFPKALIDTVIPTSLCTTTNYMSDINGSKYKFMFTLKPNHISSFVFYGSLIFIGILIIFLFFRFCHYKDLCMRGAYIGSFIYICFNATLHALWGNEYFLYSQHWIFPIFILIIYTIPKYTNSFKGYILTFGLILIFAFVSIYNIFMIQKMFCLLKV